MRACVLAVCDMRQWDVIARNDAAPCRYIYVARNPKDTAVSLFHHMRAFKEFEYTASWDEHFENFMDGLVETSSWFRHVLPWWQHRHDDNILFIKYEDLQRDLAAHVRIIAAFLGMELTDGQVDAVVVQSSFEAMKSSDKASMAWTAESRHADAPEFMRKGIVGTCDGWVMDV